MVAGGSRNKTALNTTEILDLASLKWSKGLIDQSFPSSSIIVLGYTFAVVSGPPFPFALEHMASVQYGDTFFTVGGSQLRQTGSRYYYKTIYRFDNAKWEWVTSDERLNKFKDQVAAFPVHHTLFPQCRLTGN